MGEVLTVLRTAASEAAKPDASFGLYFVSAGSLGEEGRETVSSGVLTCNSPSVALGMMMISKPQGRYLRWLDGAIVTYLGPWKSEFRFLLLSPWEG